MDVEAVCRCCLSRTSELKDLSSWVEVNNSRDRIIFILTEYLNIQAKIGDAYPQSVCLACINQLTNIYTFRKTVINSHKTYKYFKIKAECAERKTKQGAGDDKVKVEAEHYEEDLLESNGDSEKWDVDVSDLSNDSCEDGKQEEKALEQTEEDSPSASYFYCTYCSDKFPTASELYTHCCDSHPPINKKGVHCKYCNDLYPFPKTLEMHIKCHLFPYVCPFCVEGFKVLKSYKQHVSVCDVSGDVDPPLKTTDPGDLTYVNYDVLRQCHFCGKSVKSSYLWAHERTHKEKKYECKICGKRYVDPTTYKMHVRDFHSTTQGYECNFCDKKFKFRSGRYTHIQTAHKKVIKHICPTCGKGFFSKMCLTKHMRTHTGERPFSCHVCSNSYKARSGLNIHLKTHDADLKDRNVTEVSHI